jgi:hypothetical protein
MKECDSTSRIRLTDSVRQSDLDEDSMQTKRWVELIRQGVEEYCVEGINLLKAMEQSVEEEMSDQEPEATRLLTVTLCVSNPYDYVNHMFKRL